MTEDIGTTPAGGKVSVVPPSDGYKSRKFIIATVSAFAVMAYAMVARALGWITEDSLEYLTTASLVAIATYCGFNIAEKLGMVTKVVAGLARVVKPKETTP